MRGWMNPWRLARFIGFYAVQIVIANVYVAWEILTPTHHMSPGIIAVPMRSRTAVEITFLANLVSLTPGTIAMDADEDTSVLYVHGLHVGDPERFRESIRRLEDRLLEVLR